MVLALRPPAHDRLFVAPGRQRKEAALRPLAFEPLVVDEAINGLEPRLEIFCEIEIVAPALLLGLDDENYSEHGWFLSLLTLLLLIGPMRRCRVVETAPRRRLQGMRCFRDVGHGASSPDASDACRGRS